MGATYQLVGTGETYEREGLTLTRFSVEAQQMPLTDAYLAELRKEVTLPESLTFAQLQPYLLAAGLDVDALITTLAQTVRPEVLQALVAATAQPIELDYVLTFSGSVGVDLETGSEVEVSAVHETIGVRPSAAQLKPLLDALAEYQSVPAIAQATDVLAGLADEPIAVADYEYAQTADSVTDMAAEVKDQRSQIDLAERLIPLVCWPQGSSSCWSGRTSGSARSGAPRPSSTSDRRRPPRRGANGP